MTEDLSSKTLCLVDGSGYIFRAFYALPTMTRQDGTPVNAVYGFMTMLMNLTEENAYSHIVVVFDAKRRNFRNDFYPAYKATRRETPPELIPQFPLIRQATEALNIPWIEQEGFEADDLIATYARLATEAGWQVHIISADKDLMQLMRPMVSLYDPMKKKELSEADVAAKFGVTPDKVVDVQALMGDSTDNVPGATGIGPKTAAELINHYGSVENLLDNLDTISLPKRREGILRDRDQILISKRLVKLEDHAPVQESLDTFQARQPNKEKLLAFLDENQFKRLISKVQPWSERRSRVLEAQAPSANVQETYELIQDEAQLQHWIDIIKTKKQVALDTETTGLNPLKARLVGFSLCYEAGKACYVPLRHGALDEGEQQANLFDTPLPSRPKQIPVQRALQLLRPILENTEILKIGHNIKYDMQIFANEYGCLNITPIADTMVMSSVLDGSQHRHNLDDLALLYFNHQNILYKDVCGSGRTKCRFDELPLEKACPYAAEDADMTWRLYTLLAPRLQGNDARVYTELDLPLIPILARMERCGILVDRTHLIQVDQLFSHKLNMLTKEIHLLAGEEFNINSPAQLGVILFEKQGLSGGKKSANGAWTTDVKVLETLAAEGSKLAEKVLEYRSFSKLKSTYVDALLALSHDDPRIHTSFSLTATNTGRLASSDPNLQNIPIRTEDGKEIRRAFIAKRGYKLLAADYSQVELRLMAEVANVTALKESFLKNEDIHARTASQIFNIPLDKVDSDMRRQAKAINFGIIYGMSPFGLASQLNIPKADAKRYIDAYFTEYPEIKTYMDETTRFAEENGFVMTPFGRRIYLPDIHNKATKAFALRSAINAPIQGGAADIIKKAMIDVSAALKKAGLDASLLLQVHDELVFEVATSDVEAATALIKDKMEHASRQSIPLIVEVGVGDNWKEAH